MATFSLGPQIQHSTVRSQALFGPLDLTPRAGSDSFFEILASTFGPGPAAPGSNGPGLLIIWKNILSQICSRSII